ncbi:hypothetical protein QJS10_CPB17g02255 [Acorus calamus]|uniref:Transmembrane protein n=1 Tax=Acorus calamus TaxID=4465 RepID=A0AAV9CXN8_ACOCL|nr:hypothetical protein QJS10_CPB17g02255 [Acorus calamus]
MGDQKIGEPSILSRGWNLGKKIMIAGAAITSAPVVLPPLMIFSAVGLAFAVPFGALFAGYACTDKIMSSLLPPPEFLHNVGEGTEYEEELIDEGEDGQEMETVDYGEEPSFLRISDEERVSDGADVESEVTPPVVAQEELYDEQKIWEQVVALRRIVGYRDVLQTSYVEELNALYIFTGVEPPSSFKDPSSLVEVNDKLRFLKSVVGVK